MLFFEVLLINFLLVVVLLSLGWIPSGFLCRKLGNTNINLRLFTAVFFGYLFTQSFVAIWVTKGLTMQWLNFLPFFMLLGIRSEVKTEITAGKQEFFWRDVLIPTGMLFFLTFYMVKSYAPDFITISRQPFIDFVSYAGSAYALKISGTENLFLDKSLFFPELCSLNLYHFTELWLIRLVAEVTNQTDLWITCFIIPVFLNLLVSFSLNSLPETRKLSGFILAIIIFSLCFAQGKLLIFDDYFLFHVLDLFGTKLALIIPVFLLLWNLRKNRNLFLAFLLILPQINILLAVLLAILAFAKFFLMSNEKSRLPSKGIWLGYGLYFGAFLIILIFGMNPSKGELKSAGMEGLKTFILTFFQYGREALFNLGFLYGYPFLVLASLFRSRKYALLIFPFIIAKAIGRIAPSGSAVLAEFTPAIELICCVGGLWWIDRRFLHFPAFVKNGILIIFLLSVISAFGNAFTGFMDFEQIFTLAACSFFYLLTFAILVWKDNQISLPLLKFPGKEYILGICLVVLTWKTFRYHKSIPFDVPFYQMLRNEAEPVSRSIYFSSMHYSPFPLHVKAGIPLLFHYPDAHSIPVTQFDDSTTHGNYVTMHLKEFPFSIFCNLPANKAFSVQQNTLRFIKEYGIQFAWVDKSYPQSKLSFLEPYMEKRWVSEKEGKEFWKINPRKILITEQLSPSSAGK